MKGSRPFCVSLLHGLGRDSMSLTLPWDSPSTWAPHRCHALKGCTATRAEKLPALHPCVRGGGAGSHPLPPPAPQHVWTLCPLPWVLMEGPPGGYPAGREAAPKGLHSEDWAFLLGSATNQLVVATGSLGLGQI